jgi:hypothetical protein
MYLPSNSPIPLIQCQRAKAACKTAASAQRVQDTRETMAEGRARIFETIISPEELTSQFGVGLGVDAAKIQAQSEDARASGMLGLPATRLNGPSLAQLVADAPTVVSLNRHRDQDGCTDIVFSQVGVGPVPNPSMPHGAPRIVQTTIGPMYFRGPDATYPLAYPHETFGVSPSGLTGINPPWSDAWVMPRNNANGSRDGGVLGWIQSNPWLSLAIAGAAVLGLNEAGKRGRR